MTTGLTDDLRGINDTRKTAVINNELRLRVDIAASRVGDPSCERVHFLLVERARLGSESMVSFLL